MPERAAGVLWEWFGQEVVVFHPGHRQMHRLNATAGALWAELDGDRDARALAASLAKRYEVSSHALVDDIEVALQDWAALGLRGDVETSQPDAVASRAEPAAMREPRVGEALAPSVESLLDGVTWAAELGPFQGLSFQFTVRVEDPDLGRYLQRTLASLKSEHTRVVAQRFGQYSVRCKRLDRTTHDVFLDGSLLQSVDSEAASAEFLLWHINRMVIDDDVEHMLFHAGGVSAGGKGILIPGQPNAGKSTLVSGLVRSGLGYLSDEAVAIDVDTSELVPFPKAISIDHGSWPVLERHRPQAGSLIDRFQATRWQIPPDEMRSGSVSSSVPLGWIITTNYRPGARTLIEALPPIEVMTALLAEVFGLGARTQAFRSLATLVKTTPGLRLTSGDLADAVAVVRDVVDVK